MIDSYQIPEQTFSFVSKRLSNLEQSMLHCWESKLLDEIKDYQTCENII